MIWYQATHEELYKELDSSENGLKQPEARKRLQTYGPNQPPTRKEPWWRVVFEPFRSIFVVVLAIAALVSLLSHEVLDAIIIGTIVGINAIIFYSQQYATSRVLRSLKKHSLGRVRVMRDNAETDLSVLDLVPGDIVLVGEGERIPADGRVIHTDILEVNEASLTGESNPVQKHASTLDKVHPVYEQDNMVFQGTHVIAGSAKIIVVGTGAKTEFGKIAQLATTAHTKSPVQTRIDRLIAQVVRAVALLAGLVFILALARGIPTTEALRFVLSLSVSAVPEGLPVALTVILVLGMRRMAKKKALVRSFKAIEDVGLITTIATDKTGTITTNHLTLAESWSIGKNSVITSGLRTVNPEQAIDPLDAAIVAAAPKSSLRPTKTYSFDIATRMSGAFYDNERYIYIKGSPEHILARCKLGKSAHHDAESQMHAFASRGLRVIAVATKKIDGKPPESLDAIRDLNFVGFIALSDQIRSEVPGAIHNAQAAGIEVLLVTGDHYETAYNIGKHVGIASHPEQVIEGTKLPRDAHDLALSIKAKTVFARIVPEDKFRILQALKQDRIVAMTGDGVNDVPALANAHVGFAMGSGSDMAKDAGGIVLLNDNFATIVEAIREGRKIYDNIRRMVFYLLATSLGGVLTMILALLFNLPLPVTAIQILWINLVTDTALVLPLGLEPEEQNIMKRPPRNTRSRLLNRPMLVRMCLVALTMASVTIWTVHTLRSSGYEIVEIQTVAFMVLVVAQWANAFNARSVQDSSFSRLRTRNPAMFFGFAAAISLQALALFGPLKKVLGITPVPIVAIVVPTVIMTVAVIAVAEIHKKLLGHHTKKAVSID